MNVYYLPSLRQHETPSRPRAASRWSELCARTLRAWWRLRLTVRDVCAVIRRGGARPPLDDHDWVAADEAPAPRRRALGPARILDLEAARRRRTPAAASV
jgi:hypothetical protein